MIVMARSAQSSNKEAALETDLNLLTLSMLLCSSIEIARESLVQSQYERSDSSTVHCFSVENGLAERFGCLA